MEKNKKELKIFLSENNKSGYKTKKNYINTNFPKFSSSLKSYIKRYKLENIQFKEQLFLFLNDLNDIPICLTCGEKLKFKRSIKEGYGTYCSIKCTNKSEKHINNVKSTNIKRYGGVAPCSSSDVMKKMSDTNFKNYGVHNFFEKKDIIQKKIFEKYGNSIMTKTDHYKKIMKEKYEKKYEDDKVIKNNKEIIFHCDICGENSIHEYNSFNYRQRNNISLCLKCVPPYQSMIEEELENFLIENGYNFKKHDRVTITPKEIDFFIEDKKIGIELNGLYYHSEKFIPDKNYHKNKWISSERDGIHLFQIWEDEWKFKKEIVQNIIKNRISGTNKKIWGRKCEIKLIDNNAYKSFIEDHHIQGYAPSKIKLGLFYKNELVQIMSFSGNRKSMGGIKKEGEYEMIRLCTKSGINVVGGSEKLLSYFEKIFKPLKITSYCDVRYFTGKTYYKMGFELKEITKPNYFYLKPNEIKRYQRFNFRKDKLIKMGFSKSKTEYEITKELGYLRLWDCGNKKFVKIYEKF